MAVDIKVSLKRVESMEMDHIYGLMVAIIQDTGTKINYQVMESTNGNQEEATKEDGSRIKCMVRVFMFGKMEESMRVGILMIKSMGRESTTGLMGECLKENGSMEREKGKGN